MGNADPSGAGGFFQDPAESHNDLRMIARGMREGWLKPFPLRPDVLAKVVEGTAKALETGSEFERTTAQRVIAQMHANNIRLAEMVDKTERLDAGKETDRIGLVDERIAASLKANGRKDLKDSLGG